MTLRNILIILPFLFANTAYSESGHKHHSHGNHMMDGAHKFNDGMKPILDKYLMLHKALMNEKTNDFKAISSQIAELSDKLDAKAVKGEHAGHYKHVPMNLRKHATNLGKSKNVEEAREAFKKLSQPMAMWVGMAKPKGYSVMYCPMVKASWVQKDGETQNPYDKKMPRCGSKV